MADNKDREGASKRKWWLNAEEDPPQQDIKVGGIVSATVGKIPVELVDPIELQQIAEQPGVETNLVEENGKKIIKVSVNKMVLQTDKITGKKQEPPLGRS